MLDDSPEGKMIDTILASVNQFQSDLNSRKTRKALQEKFDQGWWPGWAPLGYINVAQEGTDDGQRARKTVKSDPQSWYLLREGFRLYLTGNYSADHLRDILHEKGLRSKTGKRIPHSIMVHILKNPFYAGLMVWKGQRKTGRHEPMISLQEHQRIQELIDSHNLHVSRGRKHRFLLRGFVFCAICGQKYTAEIHSAKNRSYYHCATMRGHSNRNQNVDVLELEHQVEEQFKTIQFSPAFIECIMEKLQQVHAGHRQTVRTQKQVLLNQRKAVEANRDRAEEKLLAGVLSDDSFVRLRARFTEHLGQIQEQIVSLDSQRECDTEVVRQVLNLSCNVYDAYKKAPDALKRQYLGLFWDRFLVRDRKIVEAIPTELIRLLQKENEVILSTELLPSSPLVITLADNAYLAAMSKRIKDISSFQLSVTHL
jgi:site-specific DNA recombinase